MSDVTLQQRAYNIIQGKLLDGELRAGDVVSEGALADEIGMSRTPVREAIGQLQSEGLFGKLPRVGTIVRLPERGELAEIYEVREALESCAASRAQLGAADLDAMARLRDELKAVGAEMKARGLDFLDEALLHRFFDADLGFHLVVVRAYNHRALRIVSELRVAQRIFEYERVAHSARLVEEAAAQHSEILEALRAGQSKAAGKAMARHIRASAAHALQAFERRSSPGMTPPRPALSPNVARRLPVAVP